MYKIKGQNILHMLFSYIQWEFHHNYHVEHVHVLTKMDDDIDDLSSDFLPDSNNEKSPEQLLFDSKVYHANKQFVRIRTNIIKWILSQAEHRSYPKHVKNNKRAFQQTVL